MAPDQDWALASAMRSLSMRSHSAFELGRKLRTKGVDAQTVDRVIERLKEIDLIDDVRFAREYVEFGFLRKSWGIKKVRAGLMEKGIDREIINEVLGGDEAARMEREAAARFVQKEMRRGGRVEVEREKIIARLLARGFGWDTASEAIKGLQADPSRD